MSLLSPTERHPLDLSKVRHELRTPINHILGYCDMLLEDEEVPAAFRGDLNRIHDGGRQLLSLINHYFDENTFASLKLDLHQLCHELRTPVNHIVGYSELLEEQAREGNHARLASDLGKVSLAAATWLGLMEEHLIAPTAGHETGGSAEATIDTGIGFRAPQARSAQAAPPQTGSLLLVDDDPTNREMLARRLQRQGYTVTMAENGLQGIKLLRSKPFDLVLLDLIMPGLDGCQVLTRMKADPGLKDIPVIMISALDQENGIARCIELGAEDYVAKPFNPVFLRARIGACLEKKRLRDQERKTLEALIESQRQIAADLSEAAQYVTSLLPEKLDGEISTDWIFKPSDQLGGDAFGYHWLDATHLAIYLIDVSGHGVGAALLSVSVINALRARSIAGADFYSSASVLRGLNRMFSMDQQNHLYFTMWYGIFNQSSRNLRFSSGGHPPALLFHNNAITELSTNGPAIGCMEEVIFAEKTMEFPVGSQLFILSDGVYEIARPDGTMWTCKDFQRELLERLRQTGFSLGAMLQQIELLHGRDSLDDDFSLLQLRLR